MRPVLSRMAGDGDDESQVRVDEQVLGVKVTTLNALREIDLGVRSEQLVLARTAQELVQRRCENVVRKGLGNGGGGQTFLSWVNTRRRK